jgi:hypothetical protein
MKSFREQNKKLFAHALARAIDDSALENQYADGFVEWAHVRCEITSWMDELEKQ